MKVETCVSMVVEGGQRGNIDDGTAKFVAWPRTASSSETGFFFIQTF